MSKSDYNLASIEKSVINIDLSAEQKKKALERDLKRQTALIGKYRFFISEIDKIPDSEPTRWEMLWTIIRVSYKVIKILYYILKILNLVQTIRENKKMSKATLTTIVGSIVGTILTIIMVVWKISIPPEVAPYIVGLVVAALGFVWKPNEKEKK